MNSLVSKPKQDIRRMRITSGIDLNSYGIEYGPLHRVIMPREICPNIRYVDFKARDQLVEHHANNPNVDVSLIPEIDIVTDGQPITQFVPDDSIDFVIASHVLEHVPDFIGWLETNLRLLRHGGRIALAFPDRRYCFDLAKQPSSFHELVAAHLEERTQPNFTQVCDHILNIRKVTPAEVWNGTLSAETAPPVHNGPVAINLLRALVKKKEYQDVHCWKFTDAEFIAMLETVKLHFKIPFEILSLYPTRPYTLEFYAVLVKT